MSCIVAMLTGVHKFLSRNLFYPIALSTFLVFGYFAGGVLISNQLSYRFVPWNLFLAWLPYIFSLTMAAIHLLRPRWWWAQIIPGALWLLFLPNAFYIMTDLIHLTQRQSIPIWYDAGLLAITAWTGIFLAIVSLHTVQGIVQSYFGTLLSWGFALVVIGLSGYGVYLGRFLRWNSWDVLSNPKGIAYDTLSPLINPLTYADKIGFMVMYTSLFLVTYLTYAWLRPFNHSDEKQVQARLENVHNL
jgi:uncharacterized membrane protein